jgi:hypothetical protein
MSSTLDHVKGRRDNDGADVGSSGTMQQRTTRLQHGGSERWEKSTCPATRSEPRCNQHDRAGRGVIGGRSSSMDAVRRACATTAGSLEFGGRRERAGGEQRQTLVVQERLAPNVNDGGTTLAKRSWRERTAWRGGEHGGRKQARLELL